MTSVDLPDLWWNALRHSLDRLRDVPTTRFGDRPVTSRRARDVLGIDIRIQHWETVHGDLR